jgi:hypothetical protein
MMILDWLHRGTVPLPQQMAEDVKFQSFVISIIAVLLN